MSWHGDKGAPGEPGISAKTIISKVIDSGMRTKFNTGAVRETGGKGRCDLLPLDIIGRCYDDDILRFIYVFIESKDCTALWEAIGRFRTQLNIDRQTMLLELALQFEDGAKKYADDNWKHGIPIHCYIDSAIRHYLKWQRGDNDEHHDRAFIWNLICAIWTMENMPELMDIKSDIDYIQVKQKNK